MLVTETTSITYLFVNMVHSLQGAFISPKGCFEETILGMQNNILQLRSFWVKHNIVQSIKSESFAAQNDRIE
jgi:hypothetical protein